MVCLEIVGSLPIQVTAVIIIRMPKLVSLGILVSIAILDVVVCLADVARPAPRVAKVSRAALVSLVFLGLGLGSTFRLGLGLGAACRPT